LGYSVDAVEGIIQERKDAAALAAKALPLNGHGGDHGDGSKQGDNVTLLRGNDISYLTARIARDRHSRSRAGGRMK
jgi:hypothetical protein